MSNRERSHGTSIALENREINIDGIPRRVGSMSDFLRSFIINAFLGLLSFFCVYYMQDSTAAKMGSISGLGFWIAIGGVIMICIHFFLEMQLSVYLAGLVMVVAGLYYLQTGLTKYFMARRFAVTFSKK